MQKRTHYVIGGGIVGATTALMLSSLGSVNDDDSRIVIYDPNFAVGQDQRAMALSARTVNCLKRWGINGSLFEQEAMPIERIHVSEQGRFHKVVLDAAMHGLDQFGCVVSMSRLISSIYKVLQQRNILMCKKDIQSLSDVESEDENISFFIAGGHKVKIGGVSRPEYVQKMYDQTAILFSVKVKERHEGMAFERFMQNELLALLPVTHDTYKVVWAVPNAKKDFMLNLSDIDLIIQLQKCMGYAGCFIEVGMRQTYPMVLFYTLTPNRPNNILLMGHSSHILHPVSGQGYNLSVQDIALLDSLLISNGGVANEMLFSEYVDQRRPSWLKMIKTTDRLVEIFRGSRYQYFRPFGMGLMQKSSTLQSVLVNHMMGSA